MSKARTTVTHDEDVFRAVEDLTEIWAKVEPAEEDEGLELAASELRAMRESSGASGS